MTKIKIFRDGNESKLEDSINKWIDYQDHMPGTFHIVHTQSSVSALEFDGGITAYYLVTVWYRFSGI